MTDMETRRNRVANGSRRKRDLQAVGPTPILGGEYFDREAFAAEYFPDETVGLSHAIHVAYIRAGRKKPEPAAVLEVMEEKGWTLAQRKAMP